MEVLQVVDLLLLVGLEFASPLLVGSAQLIQLRALLGVDLLHLAFELRGLLLALQLECLHDVRVEVLQVVGLLLVGFLDALALIVRVETGF